MGQGHHLLSPRTSQQQTRTVSHSIPLERGQKGAKSLQPQKPPACHHDLFSIPSFPSILHCWKGSENDWGAVNIPGGNSPGVPPEPRHKSTAEHLPGAGAAWAAAGEQPFLHRT